jgi:hypothetical protein
MYIRINIKNQLKLQREIPVLLGISHNSKTSYTYKILSILEILNEIAIIDVDNVAITQICADVLHMIHTKSKLGCSVVDYPHIIWNLDIFLRIAIGGDWFLKSKYCEYFNIPVNMDFSQYDSFIETSAYFRNIELMRQVLIEKKVMTYENVEKFTSFMLSQEECFRTFKQGQTLFEKYQNARWDALPFLDCIIEFIARNVTLIGTGAHVNFMFVIFWHNINKFFNSQYKNWRVDAPKTSKLGCSINVMEYVKTRKHMILEMRDFGRIKITYKVKEILNLIFSALHDNKTVAYTKDLECTNTVFAQLCPNADILHVIRAYKTSSSNCSALYDNETVVQNISEQCENEFSSDNILNSILVPDLNMIPSCLDDILNRTMSFFVNDIEEANITQCYVRKIRIACIVSYIHNLIIGPMNFPATAFEIVQHLSDIGE